MNLTCSSIAPLQSFGAGKSNLEGLIRVPFFLEVPPHLLEVMPLPNPVSRWFVDGDAVDVTFQKLAQAGVPPTFLNLLRQPDKSVRFENGVVFFPPPGELAALNPVMRAAVYQILRQFPKNEEITAPFVYGSPQDLRRWFGDTQVRLELINLIEQFSYPWGNALAFSDVAFLIGQTQGESEARRVMKALNRTPTLQLKIAIQPDSDPAKVSSQWATGLGDRGWRASTMISSWCHAKKSDLFDVTHLLPQIPRMLVYTFPSLSMGMGGELPDAQWTSQHFFRSEMGSARPWNGSPSSMMSLGFTPVHEPYQFGDVLMYWSQNQQEYVHSSVFVADGIVFTKNSPKLISPWVLQEGDMVKNIHLNHPEDQIQGYRKVVAGLN
jgi:hypothetical protein